MCFPLLRYLSHIPFTTKLFDSLAPEVYIISSLLTFKLLAIFWVHSSIIFLASLPNLCEELGLAKYLIEAS